MGKVAIEEDHKIGHAKGQVLGGVSPLETLRDCK